MPLTLYYHPLSSFCWKALIALYEAQVPFEPFVVSHTDPATGEAFRKVWPLGKFPVVRDEDSGETIPESSIIIEYLAERWPAARGFVPADPQAARHVRLLDRLIDNYVHLPFQ